MRAMFGFLSLLLALWVVSTLVKSQLALKPAPSPNLGPMPGGQTPQQVQQHYQEALDRTLQQTRRDLDSASGTTPEGKP